MTNKLRVRCDLINVNGGSKSNLYSRRVDNLGIAIEMLDIVDSFSSLIHREVDHQRYSLFIEIEMLVAEKWVSISSEMIDTYKINRAIGKDIVEEKDNHD